MTDYVKSTNFASKDSLATGNPLKIVKGTEFDAEFNNIATAVATKADLINPVLTGTPTAPTADVLTSNTQIATTAYAVARISRDAPTKNGGSAFGDWNINISGNLVGTSPTTPTAIAGSSNTMVANTAFVATAVQNKLPLTTWTITETAGVLYFNVNGVAKAKLDGSGNLTVTGNVTGYGSV